MTTVRGFAIFSQLAVLFPSLLICGAAFVVAFLRWKQAPRAALFCAIGFGLLTLNAIMGVFAYAFILNGNFQSHGALVAMQLLGISRIILNISGLVFLLIAVFSDRRAGIASNIPDSAANRPPAG